MPYRLLKEFERLFAGRQYKHRDSSLGDFVALHLYEDLVDLNRSEKLQARIRSRNWVVNRKNTRQGVRARRPDGTFGELVPGQTPEVDDAYKVARGVVATVEIGAEVKILAKAMIKQIDRVMGDLKKQVAEFKQRGGTNCICVGIVGINQAPYTVTYEGERVNKTDGGRYPHPVKEAPEAERRLRAGVQQVYDELIILKYSATNEDPYPFSWSNWEETERDYAASLLRICREYDQRFG